MQLLDLLENLNHTVPHCIRYLKQNDGNTLNEFTTLRIAEQLVSGGVLEAVRVYQAVFPVRFSHEAFMWEFSSFVQHPPSIHAVLAELVVVWHEKASSSASNKKLLITAGVQIGKQENLFSSKFFWGFAVVENDKNARLWTTTIRIQYLYEAGQPSRWWLACVTRPLVL